MNDVLAFIQGTLDPGREKEVKKRLTDIGYDPEELDSLRDMNAQLGKIPVPKPSKAMSTRFYNVLEAYKQEEAVRSTVFERLRSWMDQLDSRKVIVGLAYSVVLLFIGWSAGIWFAPNPSLDRRLVTMSSELQEMKTIMTVALLDHPSPTERIKAVHVFANQTGRDDSVIEKLLKTLSNDPNINVRLVALEALVQFVDNPKVREGLIKAISLQNSPLMQLAMTDAMVGLNEREAVDSLKQMLEQKDLNYTVRGRIERGLELLI